MRIPQISRPKVGLCVASDARVNRINTLSSPLEIGSERSQVGASARRCRGRANALKQFSAV